MRSIFIVIAFLSLLSGCTTSKIIESPKNILPEIMDVYADSVNAKKFGIGALLQKEGKTSTYAIGWAGDSIRMTPDKIFNIASLTKTFTAVLVMQEVEDGNLQLTDSLGIFFPFHENKNVDPSITIEQLLRHKSGLGEVVIDKQLNYAKRYPYYEYNYSMLYNKVPAPVGQPGEKYQYCNTNYILLGYILEVLNDRPYQDLLQERIFNLAGMKNSYAYYSKSLENTAHPIFDGEDCNEEIFFHYYKNYAFSAGGISATLQDLQSFFKHLYTEETFLKKETRYMMMATEGEYGLGIEKYTININNREQIFYGHSGDNFSYKLRNFYNPVNGNLVIVFSNQYRDPFTGKIVYEILKAVE